ALLMTGAIARSLERGATYRWALRLLGSAAGICLFLTQSRTAILAAMAGLIAVALLRRNWMFLLGLVLVLGLYGGARSVSTSISLSESTEVGVGVREMGFETRTFIWQEQLNTWLEEPWFGRGLPIDPDSGLRRRVGENAYLELLGSVGIVGT